MLEELLALGHNGAEYDAWLIRIDGRPVRQRLRRGRTRTRRSRRCWTAAGPTPIRVFESGAILIHLAEKFGAFLPQGRRRAPNVLSWLFWQMGSAPFLGGGFGHFYAYAPTKIEYAIDRYAMEVKRQLDVLDRRLAETNISPAASTRSPTSRSWPWYGSLAKGVLYGAGEFLSVQDYKNVQRWTDAIAKRPAVQRGRMVNRTCGEPASQLHERHDASDFETKTQDKIGEPARDGDGAAMGLYEKGAVRIHFEEAGSGFPLLLIAGGGLNSTISGLSGSYPPFNSFAEFKGEYRCIAADLRNANAGQSSGPLEIDRPGIPTPTIISA